MKQANRCSLTLAVCARWRLGCHRPKGTQDEVIIVEESSINTAISRLQAGILMSGQASSDVTAFNTVVNDPNLTIPGVRFYTEITFNPVGPF